MSLFAFTYFHFHFILSAASFLKFCIYFCIRAVPFKSVGGGGTEGFLKGGRGRILN